MSPVRTSTVNASALAASLSFAVGDDAAWLVVPEYQKTKTRNAVVWCHFYGDTAADDFMTDYRSAPIVAALIGAGYLVAASMAGGNNWGNQSSVDAYSNLYAAVETMGYNIDKSVVVGVSMGGLAAALSYAGGTIPGLVGCVGIAPVLNLGDMWNSGTYLESIRAAYGIAGDGSDYAAKTSGHDPALLSGAVWNGKRLRFYASPDDQVCPKATHADVVYALASGATEREMVSCTGAHGDPDQFRASDVLATINAWMGA